LPALLSHPQWNAENPHSIGTQASGASFPAAGWWFSIQ
jgi:hypothetical protein